MAHQKEDVQYIIYIYNTGVRIRVDKKAKFPFFSNPKYFLSGVVKIFDVLLIFYGLRRRSLRNQIHTQVFYNVGNCR